MLFSTSDSTLTLCSSAKAVLFSRIPAAFTYVMHSRHDYDFYTEPQKNAYDVRKYWPRGEVILPLDQYIFNLGEFQQNYWVVVSTMIEIFFITFICKALQ